MDLTTLTPEQKTFLTTPIKDLPLGHRVKNVILSSHTYALPAELKHIKLTHGFHLLALSEEDWNKIPNFGPMALREIKNVIVRTGGFSAQTPLGIFRNLLVRNRERIENAPDVPPVITKILKPPAKPPPKDRYVLTLPSSMAEELKKQGITSANLKDAFQKACADPQKRQQVWQALHYILGYPFSNDSPK